MDVFLAGIWLTHSTTVIATSQMDPCLHKYGCYLTASGGPANARYYPRSLVYSVLRKKKSSYFLIMPLASLPGPYPNGRAPRLLLSVSKGLYSLLCLGRS